jgi:hypothetical protein
MGTVEQTWAKLDKYKTGNITLDILKDNFHADKHPDVSNGRKTPDEVMTDFIEVYDVHHNCFNDYNRTNQVSKAEFVQYYRTLNPNYQEDLHFNSMVRNVWDVKEVKVDNRDRSFAGGNDPALNSRDRYMRQNVKNTPFGTSQADQANNWTSSNRQNYGQNGDTSSKTAGGATKQFAFV